VSRFQHMRRTVIRTLKNIATRDTQIKLYKVITAVILMYGSGNWALSTTETVEMRFLRRVSVYTPKEHIRNSTIRSAFTNVLNIYIYIYIYDVYEIIQDCKNKWHNHILRTDFSN
jgi:hypothetical protein